MSYLGKFDIRFMTFVKKKYGVRFKTYDDYITYLYDFLRANDRRFSNESYYIQLEKDIEEFVEWQEELIKKW